MHKEKGLMKRIYQFIRLCLVTTLLAGMLQPMVLAQAKPRTPALPTKDQASVVVKFKVTADVELVNNTFVSHAGQTTDQLNQRLSAQKTSHKARLLNEDRSTVRRRRAEAKNLASNEGDLDNYYTIQLQPGQTADQVANDLKQLGVVETAYAKPLPAPAPTTPSYVSAQKYLTAAPTGMGVNATIGGTATLYPASTGAKVKVADLEYSWNTSHEDLSKLRATGALWANGTPVDPFNDTNHGTAAIGIAAADRNGLGVDGIVPNAEVHMVNTNNAERGWDVAGAIYTAANKMSAGDVILLEQQAWAPDNLGFAPIEIYQANYDAVKYATAKGIIVVEPAGNGKQSVWEGYNLDDSLFGGIFTSARSNSGALIVGAGGAGCSTTARARMAFSNYGSRVDVQGYGECVATTGYGDLSAATANSLYTSSFNGTSSASATIMAVAAELSSSFKQTNTVAMSPSAMRNALRSGATAQNATVAGNIGPLPNMAANLKLTDITKPSVPVSLSASLNASNKPVLRWNASSDNLGVVTYNVYRGTTVIATLVNRATYTDTTTRNATSYSYKVVAVDASGNTSTVSNAVTVRTR